MDSSVKSFKVGEAPWETESTPSSFKVGEAPWEKKQDKNEIVEEMHPSISKTDRAIVKNFSGGDTEAGADYLRKKHPNLEVKTKNGRILMRGDEKEPWRPLDPDTGFFSSDFVNDATDIAYDAASGIGESVATGIGALGGTLVSPGAGTLAGGAVASGAASTASEGFRQYMANKFGMQDGVDTTSLAVSGGLGLASPLLLGVGGKATVESAKQGLKKALQKTGNEGAAKKLSSALARKTADLGDNYADGLGYRAMSAIGKTGQRLATPVDGRAIDIVKKSPQMFDDVGRIIDEGGLDEASSLISGIKKDTGDLASEIGDQQLGVLKGIDEVDITPIREKFEGYLGELGQKYHADPTDYNYEALQKAKDQYAALFKNAKTGKKLPTVLSGEAAYNRQRAMKDIGNIQRIKPNAPLQSSIPAGKLDSDKNLINFGQSLYHDMNDILAEASGGASKKAKDEYRELSQFRELLKNKFGNEERAVRNLEKIGGDQNKVLKKQLTDKLKNPKTAPIAKKILDSADKAYAAKMFGTKKSNSIPLATLGGTLGTLAGYNAGEGYSGAAMGGMAGTGVGAAIASPTMLRRWLRLQMAANRGANSVQKMAPIPMVAPMVQNALDED